MDYYRITLIFPILFIVIPKITVTKDSFIMISFIRCKVLPDIKFQINEAGF